MVLKDIAQQVNAMPFWRYSISKRLRPEALEYNIQYHKKLQLYVDILN